MNLSEMDICLFPQYPVKTKGEAIEVTTLFNTMHVFKIPCCVTKRIYRMKSNDELRIGEKIIFPISMPEQYYYQLGYNVEYIQDIKKTVEKKEYTLWFFGGTYALNFFYGRLLELGFKNVYLHKPRPNDILVAMIEGFYRGVKYTTLVSPESNLIHLN